MSANTCQPATLSPCHPYYEVHGAGGPVVLLHGGLGNGLEYMHQIPVLAARYRVIVVDSRGHGRTPHGPQPLSYELFAADVLSVLDHLAIDQASVVGASDGAITGLQLAITHPERLRKVVAFGANVTPDGVLDAAPTPALEPLFARFAADYRRLSPEPDDFAALAVELDALYRVAPNFTAEELRSITVPVLILHGEHDEFIAADQPRQMAALIPGATLVIMPGAGHYAHLQQPAEFNRIVLEYLAE
jgi:pimeloyl-ACP methyl ester carboxylesterase